MSPERDLCAEFKKATTEEKPNLFNSLLKGFQEEVDNITKRAKFAENAFLNIYQKIYEAPDPYPALASITVISWYSISIPIHHRFRKIVIAWSHKYWDAIPDFIV